MKFILKLKYYIFPYWKESILALILLTAVVLMDLAIPRLIQRLIDDGETYAAAGDPASV